MNFPLVGLPSESVPLVVVVMVSVFGNDRVIISGHARALAARRLALQDVPVIVIDHLTSTQRRALLTADNRLALSAGWDE